MTIRKSHGVIHIPTNSRGTAQWPILPETSPEIQAAWHVWFNKSEWKGDPDLVGRDRLVKLDVPVEELREE